MKTINVILSAAIGAMLAGCSTTPQVLDRVGPGSAKVGGSVGEGHLVVRTATEAYPVGENPFYYVHTDYEIYTSNGKPFKWIRNHTGSNGESPTLVTLPSGDYTVHAKSDFGPVIVPVLIVPLRKTEVNLDSARARMSRNTHDTSVVWIPKGRSRAYYDVGARAEDN